MGVLPPHLEKNVNDSFVKSAKVSQSVSEIGPRIATQMLKVDPRVGRALPDLFPSSQGGFPSREFQVELSTEFAAGSIPPCFWWSQGILKPPQLESNKHNSRPHYWRPFGEDFGVFEVHVHAFATYFSFIVGRQLFCNSAIYCCIVTTHLDSCSRL